MDKGFVPKIRVEHFPTGDKDRFRVSMRVQNFSVASDGRIVVWLERGDIANLQTDCSFALWDDESEDGELKATG